MMLRYLKHCSSLLRANGWNYCTSFKFIDRSRYADLAPRKYCTFLNTIDHSRYDTSVEECMPYFHDIVQELTTTTDGDLKEVAERHKKIIDYNVPNGKKLRVRATVTAYKILESEERLTPENLRLAYIMGWCVEILNGYYLIVDDIEDASLKRRGLPCWYMVEGVGLTAINDGIILEYSVFSLLKKFFSNHKCYVPAMEVFHYATIMSSLGQALDMERPIQKNGLCDLTFFSAQRYNAIAKYKTHYYTTELPVRLVMYLADEFDVNKVKSDFEILKIMSHFFQVQNDFLDCFDDSTITGKIGTDIEEGKCTWLIVTALQRANPSQRKILEENYGKSRYENVSMVRTVYEDLNIPEAYYTLENNVLNLFKKRTHKATLPDVLFEKFNQLFCKKISNYRS